MLGGSRADRTSLVTIELTDAKTGRSIAGLLRVTDADGNVVLIPELLSRGRGLDANLPIAKWWVLPSKMQIRLPSKKLTIESISGLETKLARQTVDLTDKESAHIDIPLTRFYDARAKGLRSANTHLHLQKISRADCDRYLREIPKADDLDVLFLSYLERAGADREYTSNRYTKSNLAELTQQSGVLFGNGEEHRHNFTGFGQGYGHVMLLDIKKLVLPVSIGPGIMKSGHDGLPLQRGIKTAHRDGATVVWCHNEWGTESFPNWVTGNLDAQNIFDGGIRSSYKDSFYRYLNVGIRVPFSTGTDWFMYDFSRVYVRMNQKLTTKSWLQALAAGRSYISNGPLLEFRVDNAELGDTLRISKQRTVKVVARAVGRVNFEKIELIHNGRVIASASTNGVDGYFEAKMKTNVDIGEPGWMALRTPPPSVAGDRDLKRKTPSNELGRELFSHTSPIYFEVDGRQRLDHKLADQLLSEMELDAKTISERGKFQDEQAKQRVLDVYRDGIAKLREQLAKTE
jgi:hypothetical protein